MTRRRALARIGVWFFGMLVAAQGMPASTRAALGHHAPGDDFMRRAQTLADTRIENFRNATDPVARRTAFLEMQADPIAVQRLNALDAEGRPIHRDVIHRANTESTAIRTEVKSRLKTEIAARYNVPESAVQTVEYGKTPQSHPDAFGQDWDLTARINGRDVPAPVSQKVAHQAYLDSATMNGKIRVTVTDPKTGVVSNITPDQFAYRQSLAVTDHLHPDAYAGGKTGGKAANDLAAGKLDPATRFRDPTQLAQSIEFKSNEAAERAHRLQDIDSRPVDAEAWKLEQVRQSTKQFDKFVDPMVRANGGQVPETLRDGMDVLRKVSSGELTPAQAQERLKALGEIRGAQPESIESIIRKNAQLVEAAQVLKDPGTRGGAIDRNDFVESVRDRLANRGMDLDAPRDLSNAKAPDPDAARRDLVEKLRNNDLLDPETRNKLADQIEARDARARRPAEPNVPEGKAPAGELDWKGKARAGVNRAGEAMMIVDGFNVAQDLVDAVEGKKAWGDVGLNVADLASLGVLGTSRTLTEKALDRADAADAVAEEQARLDEARNGVILGRLQEAGVSALDRTAAMRGLALGDDGPLNALIERLREQGKPIEIPEREIAEVEADDTLKQRAIAMGSGMVDHALRGGGFVLNTLNNVVIEIPWSSVDTILSSISAFNTESRVTDQRQAMIDDLVRRGADPDQAFAAVAIFLDSAGADRELLDRMRFELAVLEAHPELRKLSPEALDRALYDLHEAYLADKARRAAEAERTAEAATQSANELAALAAQLAENTGRPDMIDVPEVRGMTPDRASAVITAARLIPAPVVIKPAPGNVKPFVVFEQKPATGAPVASGSSVEFYFSAEKPAETVVEVPDILRLTKEEAESKLTEAEIKLVPKPAAGDRKPTRSNKKQEVYSQVPAAGTKVAEGSNVAFEYYAGIPVGRYVGMKRDDAKKKIAEDGFAANVMEGDNMADNPAEQHNVYTQTPQPGEYAWFDDPVDALYYKRGEGFEPGDGAKVDGRVATAEVKDGEGGPRGTIVFSSGPQANNNETQHLIAWAITRYADDGAAAAAYGAMAKNVPQPRSSGVLNVASSVGGGEAQFTMRLKTDRNMSTTHGHYLVYRGQFVIVYTFVEPNVGADISYVTSIIKKSKELVDLRFPPD